MHSPHNPQPTIGLGDDRDPASELGSRLASASQTVQGLLTNYLFYGQRRSDDRAVPAVQRLAGERGHERHSEDARSSFTDHTRQATGPGPEGPQELPPPTAAATSGRAVSAPSESAGRRLQLVLSNEPSGDHPNATATDASMSPHDPLAANALTDDFLAQDPLALGPEEPHPTDRDRAKGRLP